ncbi:MULTISPECIES: DUF4268 domain-containing protein [unclassified Mesorhizobium]|uniref:DUF4268 domain-containing protein n=1 Tax=unclassified Mesorhizobium TaxID=325217 RepID=UPI0011269478|nr:MULTISPECIES: DUF4268 domain-containing protein [unclassified Mesorhizobium]TPK99034.1 DUF4268 domain-containing protein [Mesorhizobium sp. B2-4-16]TPL73704.1 DUF4268 domain-containing protein [Mesorhizobium sp. B2-4-3]
MPIYEIAADKLLAVTETSFGAQGIYERKHIQRLLRDDIKVLDEHLMVIAEEFGEWLDSSRRIDLLCLDDDANLVVVELKRTEDGGHMELQALRYAAMISAMTFDQLVDTHARFRNPAQPDLEGAKGAILEFLGWDAAEEEQFGQDSRIILASADFSKELTTAVLWLIERGVDIRCVRLKPYRMNNGPVLIDIQQLIPLPETASYQTQIGVKKLAERKSQGERHELRYKFWQQMLDYAKQRTPLHAARKATREGWVSGGIGRNGFSLQYTVRREDTQVSLWISLGSGMREKNKAAFHQLLKQRAEIEGDFGAGLDWQELPESDGCLIRHVMPGGYKSPTDQWPEINERMTDAMIRLDKALRARVAALQV